MHLFLQTKKILISLKMPCTAIIKMFISISWNEWVYIVQWKVIKFRFSKKATKIWKNLIGFDKQIVFCLSRANYEFLSDNSFRKHTDRFFLLEISTKDKKFEITVARNTEHDLLAKTSGIFFQILWPSYNVVP